MRVRVRRSNRRRRRLYPLVPSPLGLRRGKIDNYIVGYTKKPGMLSKGGCSRVTMDRDARHVRSMILFGLLRAPTLLRGSYE